jgi:hypothetical protein
VYHRLQTSVEPNGIPRANQTGPKDPPPQTAKRNTNLSAANHERISSAPQTGATGSPKSRRNTARGQRRQAHDPSSRRDEYGVSLAVGMTVCSHDASCGTMGKEKWQAVPFAGTAPQYQGTHTNCHFAPLLCSRGQFEISAGWQ